MNGEHFSVPEAVYASAMSMWLKPLVREPLTRADGAGLQLLTFGLVTFDTRQTQDAMALRAPVQRQACQVRDRRLRGTDASVPRQKRLAPERDDHRLLGLALKRRARVL